MYLTQTPIRRKTTRADIYMSTPTGQACNEQHSQTLLVVGLLICLVNVVWFSTIDSPTTGLHASHRTDQGPLRSFAAYPLAQTYATLGLCIPCSVQPNKRQDAGNGTMWVDDAETVASVLAGKGDLQQASGSRLSADGSVCVVPIY